MTPNLREPPDPPPAIRTHKGLLHCCSSIRRRGLVGDSSCNVLVCTPTFAHAYVHFNGPAILLLRAGENMKPIHDRRQREKMQLWQALVPLLFTAAVQSRRQLLIPCVFYPIYGRPHSASREASCFTEVGRRRFGNNARGYRPRPVYL